MSDGSNELMLDAAGNPILRKSGHSSAGRQRLAREAAVLGRARHPGVVSLVEEALDAPEPMLVLRWAGSHTLATIPLLSVEHAAGMLAAVATTVADLHEIGVVHGRLTADHVVVGEGGRPLLCGLGDAVVGTTSAGPRPSDDVAALGRLLHRLIEGELELEPIPDGRRWRLHRRDRSGFQRRSLLTLADQAMADEITARPTARALAASIRQAVPGARLSPPEPITAKRGQARLVKAAPEAARPEVPGPFNESTGNDPGAETPDRALTPDSGASGTGIQSVVAATGAGSTGPAGAISNPSPTGETVPEASPSFPWAEWPSSTRASDRLRHGDDDPSSPGPQVAAQHGLGRYRRWRITARPVVVGMAAAITVMLAIGVHHVTTDGPPTGDDAAADPGRAAENRPPTSRRDAVPTTQASFPASPTQPGRPDTCPDTPAPRADVDSDGCHETLRVEGGTIMAGSLQFAVGRPGDLVILGDWDCDGTVTAAVARPDSQEVFVFAGWAVADGPLVVGPAATGIRGHTGQAVDEDGDGCDELLITDEAGMTKVIDLVGRP